MSDPTRRLDPADDPGLPGEHPTRRLPAPPGPNDPRPCLRCGKRMLAVEVQAGAHNPATAVYQRLHLVRRIRTGGWVKYNKVNFTVCTALVCVACGYTELVAQTPEALLEPHDLLGL
jgi:hypothetical protein